MIKDRIVQVALAVILILNLFWIGLVLSSLLAKEGDKFLHYKFNPRVVLTISNIDCMIPGVKDLFPYSAIATRDDGERLIGCYRGEGEDIIIQWYHGDQTKIPANAFLLDPKGTKEPLQPPVKGQL
jgi:hypothetical protein